MTRLVGCGEPLPLIHICSRICPLQTGHTCQVCFSVKIIPLSVELLIKLLQCIRRCGGQTAVNESRGTLEADGLGPNLASPAV